MPPRIALEVVAGPLRGKTFEVSGRDTFLFGRRSHCHAQLFDECVSRHHFLLETSLPRLALRDLGSLHGTFVNGQKLGGRDSCEANTDSNSACRPSVDLGNNDQIAVGRTVMRVRVVHDSPADGSSADKVAAEAQSADSANDEPCRSSDSPRRRRPLSFRRLLRAACNLWPRKNADGMEDRYQICSELGRGTMGVVFSARRKSDGQQVALKVMHPRVAVNDRMRSMFIREIEVTRQLQHANVVRLLEAGSLDSEFFFVIEFCNSGNLESLMRRCGGTVAPEALAPLMCQCLSGLQYAHDRGIVHRDLKPENILLGDDGTHRVAKIADLGLAKSFDKAGMSGMTMTQEFSGTIAFMPREQITEYRYERPVSDIWSMAATFYFALTGCFVREFDHGRDHIEVVLHGNPVPLRQRDPRLPVTLSRVLDRALSDDKSQRYQTAAEMKTALERAI